MFTSFGVAIDRFWAVAYPFWYRSPNSKNSTIMLIVIYWFLGFSLGSVGFIIRLDKVYRWSCLTLALISLTVFVTFNIRVYVKLRNNTNRPATSALRSKIEEKLTKTIKIMFLVYFLILCPFFTVEFLFTLCGYETIFGLDLKKYREISKSSILLNCSLNSIIYAYRVKVIRDQIKIMLKCSVKARVVEAENTPSSSSPRHHHQQQLEVES